MTSAVLNRLYASGGDEVILDTLQITVGDQSYWLTRGWDDITVTLETGGKATFTGSATHSLKSFLSAASWCLWCRCYPRTW